MRKEDDLQSHEPLPFPSTISLAHFQENSFKIYYDIFDALIQKKEFATLELLDDIEEEKIYEDLKFEYLILYNSSFFHKEAILVSYLRWRYTYFWSRKIDFEHLRTIYTLSIESIKKYLFVAHASQIGALYGWMLAHHDFFIAEVRVEQEKELSPRVREMTKALLAGDVQRVEEIFVHNQESYPSCSLFFDTLAAECMHHIGYLWETNRISVAKEHLASSTLELFFKKHAHKQMLFHPKEGQKAIVATIMEELHTSGAKVVAAALENLGFETIALLDKNPKKELLETIHTLKPAVVAFSLTMPSNLHHLQEIIRELREADLPYKGTIIAGGQALFIDAKPIEIKGVDLIANSIQAIVAFIQKRVI